MPPVVAANTAFMGSMLLNENGTLYSFGDATNGSLGDSYGRTLSRSGWPGSRPAPCRCRPVSPTPSP